MFLPVLNIRDVVEKQLCCGCGACAGIQPELFRMQDVPAVGRRPTPLQPVTTKGADAAAFRACPGKALSHEFKRDDPALIRDLLADWGPVRAVWEGYAADPVARFRGSSGGAATALSLFAIERAGMHGVLHTTASTDKPYLNETTLSASREQLLAATGSRYAPASPCDGLGRVLQAPGPCAFVGKPCDAAAVVRSMKERPELETKIGLVVAFFCAGAPSTRGNLELLRKAGVRAPEDVVSLRYRGEGWPGRWTVRHRRDGKVREDSMSYEESWGFLQRHRQWRCYICPDHTGEFADVSVGDPWYRPVQEGETGKSLIIARTGRGLRMVREAAAAGYLVLETEDATLLPRSQPNLLATRRRLWGQLFALRVSGAATPRYEGFGLLGAWRTLGWSARVRSIGGTLARVRRKRLLRRLPVFGQAGADAP